MLSALGPFAIDTYLPAMPAIAKDMGAHIAAIQSSISTFLIGYALGQIIGGPLSDQRGRRPIGMVGMALFALSSVGLAFAQTPEQLMALRFTQALGGGAATVINSAVIRDLYDGKDSARMFAMVTFIMMSAPLLAPVAGHYMADVAGWRAIFWALSIYAVCMLPVLYFLFPETRGPHAIAGTLTPASGPQGLLAALQSYAAVFKNRMGVGYLAAMAFGLGVMFTFLTNASFIYIEYFGFEEKYFQYFFGANILFMMVMNRLSTPLSNRFGLDAVLRAGIGLQLAATAVFVVHVVSGPPSIWVVCPSIVTAVGSLGLSGPGAMSRYLGFYGARAGAAAAVNGAMRFVMGALLGGLSSLILKQLAVPSLLPIAGIMMFASLVAFTSVFVLTRRRRAAHEDKP